MKNKQMRPALKVLKGLFRGLKNLDPGIRVSVSVSGWLAIAISSYISQQILIKFGFPEP